MGARHSAQRPSRGLLEPVAQKHAGLNLHQRPMKRGAITRVIVLSSLISTCSDGPAVSLNGSPTVSPTTAALCGSERLPTTWPSTLNSPDSMYFLALSQAPPPLFMTVASRIPAIVPTMSRAATDSAPIWPNGERYLKP